MNCSEHPVQEGSLKVIYKWYNPKETLAQLLCGVVGPFNGRKSAKLVNSGGQKCKITNIQLNRAIEMPKLPRWVDKVDI